MNLKHIKLAVFDVDGTLLDQNHELTNRAVKCLQFLKHRGIKLALATGRSLNRVLEFTERLDKDMQLVLLNGAWVHDLASGQDWLALNLNAKVARQAVKLLRQWDYEIIVQKSIPEAHIFYYDTYNENNKERIGRIQRNLDRCIRVDDILEIMQQDPAELTVLDVNERILQCKKLLEQANLDCRLSYSTSPFNQGYSWIEVLHPEARKDKALEFLANRLGIKRQEVLAVGDNFNDVEMLIWAGVGVAMGHAHDEVKATADIILPEDGEGLCSLTSYFQ